MLSIKYDYNVEMGNCMELKVYDGSRNDIFKRQLKHFLSCVNCVEKSGIDGLDTLQVIENKIKSI